MTHAFVFPGQGSQAVGMLSELSTKFPLVKQTFDEASEVLGYDLWQLSQIGPEKVLNQTEKTQPALLAASVAVWRVWRDQGGESPELMAGHSFGEYSALVCAEAISFKDGVKLARLRGQFMQEVIPEGEGAVAAILGLKDEDVIDICRYSSQADIVAPANFNAPGQIVIAGHKIAVERAIIQAEEMKAKRVILLPITVPVHTELMKPAARRMAESLAEVSFSMPKIPVIQNVDATIKEDVDSIREALVKQLYSPVQWTKTVKKMAEEGMIFVFECGHGKVLSGLNKRIERTLRASSIMDIQTLEQALSSLENFT
jgi:[acyl-carrier-protein] S-malonyltransferase